MSLENKNVLITGGSSGIGKALVLEYLQRGAKHIVVLDVFEFTPAEPITEKVTFIKTDVSDIEQVRKAFRDTIASLGHLDIVIANAGILKESDPNRVVQVNLIGVMNTNYTAIEYMSTSKGGRGGLVLNTASVCGLDILHCVPSYSATKHGVIGFTRCLGEEFYFDQHGVKFVALCPAFTETSLSLETADASQVDYVFSKMGIQTSEAVATCAANILADGDVKNGSVWIVNLGIATEAEMKTYWKQF